MMPDGVRRLYRSKNVRIIRPRSISPTQVAYWLRTQGAFAGTTDTDLKTVAQELMRLRIAFDSKLLMP